MSAFSYTKGSLTRPQPNEMKVTTIAKMHWDLTTDYSTCCHRDVNSTPRRGGSGRHPIDSAFGCCYSLRICLTALHLRIFFLRRRICKPNTSRHRRCEYLHISRLQTRYFYISHVNSSIFIFYSCLLTFYASVYAADFVWITVMRQHAETNSSHVLNPTWQ